MIKGAVSWKLVNADGSTLTTGEKSNVVTNDASILLAWMMKNMGNTTSGLDRPPNRGAYYLYYGSGESSWDDPLPTATAVQKKLETFSGRVSTHATEFRTGDVTALVPTDKIRLRFKVVNPAGSAELTIREMGLVGGNIQINPVEYTSQTDPREYDLLLNYVTFEKIKVPAGSTLNWDWDLTF